MSDKKPVKNNPAPEKQMPGQVISLVASKCTAEACKAKPEKAGFCSEHFVWFKEGLITLEGSKAKDFDKKFHAWQRRKSA
ncbi:MAG: hypothetical protein ACXWC9_08735 [Pseudobdellovibrionaceae bacterium]